ncbi:hypothetical protein [Halomarina rubra]|uniref:Uncharacterized protein n=1 Tax=Halomarina rubra TaxID=2071873 RepID=A0ABD6APY3_9EURY|nr:hypothetical protein [Halomarina rubra]
MANASSEGTTERRERPAQRDDSSSVGSALAFRAVGFIVLMFVIGFAIDFLASQGVIDDNEMINVLIGIFLSLGIIAILLSVVVGVLGVVRRFRNR